MPEQNPFLNGSGTFLPGEGPVLSWIKEALEEGEGILQGDPHYGSIDKGMDYIMGKQAASTATVEDPSYLSKAVLNESRRTVRRHVSALTDIKPVYAFRTPNPYFQQHAMLLNQLTAVWWINTFADLSLADAVRYGAVAGCGDLVCEYNPYYGPYGDVQLMARDARDTVPIRPSRDGSIQNWFGVIFKEAHSANVLRAMYPNRQDLLKPTLPWGTGVFTKFKIAVDRIMGGGGTLSGLNRVKTGRVVSDEVVLYKVYWNDPGINTTSHPILMGQPGTNWSYLVQPGERLYPRKRLAVATENCILYDGPSPYWHGLFPVSRLKLEHWPWSYFGLPIIDVRSGLQDTINRVMNDMVNHIRSRSSPAVVGNSRVPEHQLRQFDPRRPNAKARTLEQVGIGLTAWQTQDLPAWSFEFLKFLRQAYHESTGDANIDALQMAAMSKIPDADSIDAFFAALSPELKLEGRQVELCLREVADMQKANIFQFYDKARRMQILGDAGMTLQDFDYDPGNLIPAQQDTDKGYLPSLNVNIDIRERAQFFLKLFNFYVTPNSLLALNAKQEQMKYLQLARAGWCDIWTLGKKLEIQEMGDPPAMLLPVLTPPPPEEMPAIAAGMIPGLQLDPMTGQVLTMRPPMTIPERLQAQGMLQLGMEVNPAGRKASGQSPPAVDQKPLPGGGHRTTVVESPSSHRPTSSSPSK